VQDALSELHQDPEAAAVRGSSRELPDQQIMVVLAEALTYQPAPPPRKGMRSAFIVPPDAGLPYSLHVTRAEPGGGIPAHIHPKYAEGVFVVTGRIRVTIGDQKLEVGPGCWFLGKPNAPIGWENIGTEPAQVLAVFSPPLSEADQVWLE
jgi:quercetin dioxygenase-like cupin family protein